jgi:hypothetical protein
MNMRDDYRSTPHLSDEDGRKLLNELDALYSAMWNNESGKELKMPRSNADYWEIRHAETKLRQAILGVADRFPNHASFSDWLGQNSYEHIDAYDPLRMADDMIAAIRDLRWRIKNLEEYTQSLNATIVEYVTKGRAELPTPPPVGSGEFFSGESAERQRDRDDDGEPAR